MKSKFRWLTLVLMLGLGACGNKGDLYLPGEPAETTTDNQEQTDSGD